jgi:hypothetical protein
MFSSLMPRRKEFFEFLATHSDRVAAGANAAKAIEEILIENA